MGRVSKKESEQLSIVFKKFLISYKKMESKMLKFYWKEKSFVKWYILKFKIKK